MLIDTTHGTYTNQLPESPLSHSLSFSLTLSLSLSLSLQGAVTNCDVDAVPMFVFFRKNKVLYQVGMYMFRN